MKKIVVACLLLLLGLGAVVLFGKRRHTFVASQAIRAADTAGLWYKQAVIYTLDVEVFRDADGDGIGDFKGLISKLDYLDSLGVNTIWLAPFQPSPDKDDGYDVSDYYGIDRRLGTLADFRAFMAAARQRGMRVIMDLVLNHTSDQHPWFLKARQDARSPFHSWYVWSAEKPSNQKRGMVFPGVQQEIWTFDTVARAYYYHRFYNFQPDLNMQHPAVQQELKHIIRYWLQFGLSGFRLDAVPFLIEVPQTHGEDFKRQYDQLSALRRYTAGINLEAIILGEANVLPEETGHYFGWQGEGMHMMFNFYVNQHLFYALATGNAAPLRKSLAQTGTIPLKAQWGQFLRNHDEADLGRLSRQERRQVYQAFGPDSSMQLYDRGIRRRLAPMLQDPGRLRMAYSLLMALPSTPVLRYGDEIGMGDDLALKERLSVRTPMQWSAGRAAGFSASDSPVRPVISAGPYSYRRVNVAAARADTASLLCWLQRMIRLRKACPELSFGNWSLPDPGAPHVLALQYRWEGRTLLILHNLSPEAQEVPLPPGYGLQLLAGAAVIRKPHSLILGRYGYSWLRVAAKQQRLP